MLFGQDGLPIPAESVIRRIGDLLHCGVFAMKLANNSVVALVLSLIHIYLVKYAFALFLNHDFAKSLEVANMGLKKNPRHAAFNRLAMYNNTDLKRFEEALKAADVFFNECDNCLLYTS